MVYVVLKDEVGTILNRCDAWELGASDKMARWAVENGYKIAKSEITMMGDMIIWVDC